MKNLLTVFSLLMFSFPTFSQAEEISKVYEDFEAEMIMLSGEITRPVTVEGLRVTKGARAAIEAAGGKVVDPVAADTAKK